MKSAVSPLTLFFKSFPVRDHVYDVHTKSGGLAEGVGSWNLTCVYELTCLLFILADGEWVGGQKIAFLWTS